MIAKFIDNMAIDFSKTKPLRNGLKTGRTQEAMAHFQKTAMLPPDPTQPYLSLHLKKKAHQKLTQLMARSDY